MFEYISKRAAGLGYRVAEFVRGEYVKLVATEEAPESAAPFIEGTPEEVAWEVTRD